MIIIGAGLAGLNVADALRTEGYEGSITIIGDENQEPYHRPPLSKAFLLGEMKEEQLAMRTPDHYASRNIALRIECGPVLAINREQAFLTLADGTRLSYDGLALCTGASPRLMLITGMDLVGVHALRSLTDAKMLAAELRTATNVVMIGGGFIGLEVAAVARTQGKVVTVLEAADRLMLRAVSPQISKFYLDLHRQHGVKVELNIVVNEIVGRQGHVTGVKLNDGREFAADVVVVSVGSIPNSDLAASAGLALADPGGGILVNDCSRTSDPRIIAAGDCATHRLDDGTYRRLESIQNAVEQGKSGAASLMNRERKFTAQPTFWTEQYGIKLQMTGLNASHDEIIMRGAVSDGQFSLFYYTAGQLVAVDSVNQPRVQLDARKQLESRR